MTTNNKTFAIVGSGWRAEFYIRIALHPGNDFRLAGVLCRNQEKINALTEKYGILATMSEEEIIASAPDFIVVAVSKSSIAAVSAHWRELGFTVLCETPAALTVEELEAIWNYPGRPLLVAEQYRYYATYQKLLEIVRSGRLGEPVSAMVSLAHDYHGASLLRAVLGESADSTYRLMARQYELPIVKTADRTHIFREGALWRRNRTTAMVEFEDGRQGIYDFDGEQYHSLIRHNSIRVSGTRGEVLNERLWYLNRENDPVEERWTEDIQIVRTAAPEGQLSEDEGAILALMEQTWQVSRGDKEALAFQRENLRNALSDACFMILMQESKGQWVTARKLCWME